jgi:hypothetical protein
LEIPVIDPNLPEGGFLTWLWRRTRCFAAAIRRAFTGQTPSAQPKVLVVVEGANDIEFLRRVSAILHQVDRNMPDLGELERQFELVFVPTGGSDPSSAFRFASLRLPEFHLIDRDVPPATDTRRRVAAIVNSRPRCRAAVTLKPRIENYLHPDAIFEALGIRIAVSEDEDVSNLVASQMHGRHRPDVSWDDLPARARRRSQWKAKKLLNTRAADRMTPGRLAERDPSGEVRSWLAAITALMDR